MAKDDAAEQAEGISSMSTDGRRLIGQAIIDGILSPGNAIFAVEPRYNQSAGSYDQTGGGSLYIQNGGSYVQRPMER
jgi:hypothetical protein